VKGGGGEGKENAEAWKGGEDIFKAPTKSLRGERLQFLRINRKNGGKGEGRGPEKKGGSVSWPKAPERCNHVTTGGDSIQAFPTKTGLP